MKYRNKKYTICGRTFDSKKEADRWVSLMEKQKVGEISDLRCQVRYTLLPSQKVGGKVVERPVYYIADFVYIENGYTVVEDVKGFKTKDYILKRKMMLHFHGIQIREV